MNKAPLLIRIALFFALAFEGQIYAGPGDLDPSFGDGGRIPLEAGGTDDVLKGFTTQSDGRVVIVGDESHFYEAATLPGYVLTRRLAVRRMLQDGTPDPLFGDDGLVRFYLSGYVCRAHGVVVQGDAKIVVVGEAVQYGGTSEFLVARLLANGELDASFADQGIWHSAAGFTNASLRDVVLDSSGRILATGRASTGSKTVAPVVCLNSSGALDSTFASSGVAQISGSSSFPGEAIALQDDGRILVGIDRYMTIARLLTDGTVDVSWGGTGVVEAHSGYGGGAFAGLMYHGDGRVSVCRRWDNSTTGQMAVGRFNSDGSQDPSLGANGSFALSLGSSYSSRFTGGAATLANDGSYFFVLGWPTAPGRQAIRVAKATSAGSLDASFGTNGVMEIVESGFGTVGDAILEESSGNILVGGTLESPQTGQDILLGNLTATGQSEINWNGGNHLELNGATGDCRVNDVKVAANGQILVAATITLGTREPGCMIRRNADGSADAGFGFGGFGELANATYFRPKSVKPLPNGTMILSGVGKTTFSSSSPYYYQEGVLSAIYQENGFFNRSLLYEGRAIMPVEDISVVTSGVWTPNLGHSQFIACFRDANGLHQAVAGNSEDSSEINWLGKYGSLQYRAASLVGNYDMIAVGDDGGHAVVSRTKNGGLDKSFGDNGFVHLVWKGEKVEANTVVILTDGRMVVGGGVYEDGEPRGFMACLFGNGTKDTDFGAGGWLIFDNVSQVGVVHTIEVMPDGRMIALGEAAVNGWTTPYTALIDPAGRFDQSYGSMGVAIVPPEAGWRVTGNTMALTEDGKLIVGATAVDLLSNQVVGSPRQGVLMRLEGPQDLEMLVLEQSPGGSFPFGTFYANGRGKLDFGAVEVGDSESRELAVVRQDGGSHTALIVDVVGPCSGDYIVNVAEDASHDYARVSIQFSPTQAGLRPATLRINRSEVIGGTFEIQLLGSGETAHLSIQDLATGLESGSGLDLDFHVVAVGGIGTRNLRLRNSGTLELGQISISVENPDGQSFLVGGLPKSWLGAGEEMNVTLSFCPTNPGPVSATLMVHSSNSNPAVFKIRLTGTGRIAQQGDEVVGFGDKGIAVIESTIGSLSSARRVEELADGRLLVIGEINRVAAAMRFEKDGRVDVTFGSNGVVIIGGALGQSLALDLVELDDGSSLICGWSFSPRGYWLIKLDGRGALDTTFGLDGKTILTVPNGSAPLTGGVARFVSSDANGVTLSLWDQAIFNRLVRIGIDGSVDETFGEFGWYNSGLRRYTAYGDPSGGIMFYSSSGPTIKKLNTDLTVALGFGEDGVVSIPFSEGQVEIAEVLFDEHGGMVGVGNVNYVGGVFFRVTSEGMPPLSFQDGGLADWVDVDTALSGASAKSMELLPDGSMIGVGAANSGIQIVRVGGTGLRSRNSLGGDGSARVYGADGLYLFPNDSTVAEDGNLIVVGAAGGGRWFILKRTIGLQPQIRLRNESNAAISRAAPTIEFGQVTVGPQVTRTFSVGSDNAEFVRNVRVELVDDGGGAFSVSALDVSVILSGEWLPLEVSFTALDALPREGTLLVHSNDPEGPFAIRLTGEGPGPDLEVLDESNESLGSTVPFGSGDIGVSLSRTVTLKNAGQLALANLSVSVSGADVAAFAVDGLDGTTLGAGESLVLDLTFTPSAYRQHDAVFEIGSDDPDEPLITVSMTGKGLPPAWPSGSLKLVSAEGETLSSDGLGLYFGLVGVGQSLTRAMTVTNIGTVPINGLESSVVGGGGFASAGLASPTLNPGETVPLSATFTPTSPGGKLAVLSFTTHGGMNPVAEFSLSGSAISTLDVWRLAKFGGLANAGDAADAADIDLDGLANLMEFVTRRDPGVRDGVVTDIRADDPAEFDFCFTRDKASISSVRQIVEWSETLASDSWSEEGVVATIINDNGVVQEMCFTIPKGESGRRFVRLRLERIR